MENCPNYRKYIYEGSYNSFLFTPQLDVQYLKTNLSWEILICTIMEQSMHLQIKALQALVFTVCRIMQVLFEVIAFIELRNYFPARFFICILHMYFAFMYNALITEKE